MNHLIAHPRNVVGIGILFAVIAVAYLVLSHDVGGATLIGALAVAMTLMAYVLVAGSPRG